MNLFAWLRRCQTHQQARLIVQDPPQPGPVEHRGPHADPRTLTFDDLDDLSSGIAGALSRRGVRAGDRVVVQVDKSPEAVALYFACLRLGAVYVPLNTAYPPAELAYFVEDARPRLVVVTPERKAAVAAHHDTMLTLGALGTGTLLEAADEARCDVVHDSASDALAAMLYTSGTTGRSKGAMLSHANLRSNAEALLHAWQWRADDVLLHALPIFHVHGLFVALHCAFAGSSRTLFLPRFTVDAVLEALPNATVMMGVPTYYERLLRDARLSKENCRSIRLFTSGSAPLTDVAFQAFEARTGHRIVERYGMTEAGIITSNLQDPLRPPQAGTVGFPLGGVELRVVDDEGRTQSDGGVGEVEVRGPGVFRGYWQKPEKTAGAFRSDGFLRTGDLGQIGEDGRLALVGRRTDLIISGGLNVYPKEVEDHLEQRAGVVECAVFGVPHPDLGEAVVAAIVAEDSAFMPEADGAFDLGPDLARFKHPKRWVRLNALPRNAMGKVLKANLRASYAHLFKS